MYSSSDTFIELHTRSLLRELYDEMMDNPVYRNAKIKLPPLPPSGDLQLEAIRDSIYFFS